MTYINISHALQYGQSTNFSDVQHFLVFFKVNNLLTYYILSKLLKEKQMCT